MNVPGALDTTINALLMIDDLKVMMTAVNECLSGSLAVAEILGETNARAQAVMHEHEHSPTVMAALETARIELELRKVQLQFATGRYGN